MHAAWPAHPQAPPADRVSDAGRESTWGGPYGPYVISRHTTGDTRSATMYFVLSVWNPYNTMLMRTTVRAGTDAEPAGNPALIQGTRGAVGWFEVVTARAGSGLTHDRRNNDASGLPWVAPVTFGTGEVETVTLIEGNFGAPGNLELVARVGDRLVFYFWNGIQWVGPGPIVANGVEITGVKGVPSLIQSTWGTRGNFELAVPLIGGGIGLWFRDNDNPSFPWSTAGTCGGTGQYDAVSLIESRTTPGNLEILARQGDRLVHTWRGGPPSWTWSTPTYVVADGRMVTGASGGPTLLQARSASPTNLDALTPMRDGGGLAHLWRDGAGAWHGPTRFATAEGRLDGAAMIQSTFGTPGNLEVVARRQNQLLHYWRDSGPTFRWSGAGVIATR
jgi:hypothetical protein